MEWQNRVVIPTVEKGHQGVVQSTLLSHCSASLKMFILGCWEEGTDQHVPTNICDFVPNISTHFQLLETKKRGKRRFSVFC